MLEQEVDGERQQSTRRLVAGDQERDALGPDVFVRKVSPVCLSTPVIIRPSRSVLSAASPIARRLRIRSSTKLAIKA